MLEVLKQRLQPMGSSGAPEEAAVRQATDAQREAAGLPGNMSFNRICLSSGLHLPYHKIAAQFSPH